jgi:hypothetical protein
LPRERNKKSQGVGFNPLVLQVFQELAIPRDREKTLRKNKKVMGSKI